MSGSGHQNSRSLIDEIRDTLRLHFKGAQCFTVSTQAPTGRGHDAQVTFIPDVFGGSLDLQQAPVLAIPLDWDVQVQHEPLHIDAQINQESGVVPIPKTKSMPIFSAHRVKIHKEYGVRFRRLANSLPIKPIRTRAATWEKQRWKMETVAYRRFREAITGFSKPVSYRLTLLNQIETYKRSRHKLLFPITRFPVSVYRFSKANRDILRAHLAEKAGVQPDQVQIAQVYDRMILGILGGFQSGAEGQLLCHPKLEAFKASRDPSRNVPVYLVRGETLTHPKQKIQTVVPMSELDG